MKKPLNATKSTAPGSTTMRQQAEDTLQKQNLNRGPVAPEDAKIIHHELEVHQIELEMQNEELRRAQLELEAARARYYDLYDLAPVGYCTISEQGLILEPNLTACSLLGIDRKNLLRQPLSRFILAEDTDSYYLNRKKLFETSQPQSFEIRMLHKDSSLFWAQIEATAAQDSETDTPVCRVVLSDITGRKREEEALRESEAKFRSYFELPLHGIAITSLNKEWLQVNDRICSLLGYSRDEILRMTWTEMTHPDDRSPDLEQFNRMLCGQIENYTMDKRFIRKDGSIVWVSLGVGCVRKADGSVNYVVALLSDITDRMLAKEALLAKNAELERFTRAVSHDLKNPLITIRAFLDHLEQDMADNDKDRIKQDLTHIKTAAEKMNALLDELLRLSQVGNVINPFIETPLRELVDEASCLVSGQLEKKNVQLQVAESAVLIYGDRVRLVEVFENLISNAAKFMGEQPEPLVEVGAETKDGTIMCFVHDNGMGIDPRHKDKLFGLFERLNTVIEGTGLGLALVKRIVEVHGGRIWAESEGVGKGTCFWFTLPGKSSEE